MSGGGGTNTTKTVTSNDLPEVVDQYLQGVTPTAGSAYKTAIGRLDDPTSAYLPGGPRGIAGLSPDQTAGLGAIRGVAEDGPSDLLMGARGYAEDIIGSGGFNDPMTEALGGYERFASGEFLDSNPFRDDAIGSMQEDIRNQVAQQWAGAGQAFEGQHAGALGKELVDATAPWLYQSYEADVGRQMEGLAAMGTLGGQGISNAFTASGMAPGLDAAMLEPGKAMLAIGQLGQDQQQEILDSLYNYESLSADRKMQLDQALASLGLGVASSFPGSQSQETVTTSPREDNTLGNILGLGLGAGALFL